MHCTLYDVHRTLYTVHCTLYTVHCTLYTVHCTLYTVHCTLYTVHYTLYTFYRYVKCRGYMVQRCTVNYTQNRTDRCIVHLTKCLAIKQVIVILLLLTIKTYLLLVMHWQGLKSTVNTKHQTAYLVIQQNNTKQAALEL